jgi:hypothetical protein
MEKPATRKVVDMLSGNCMFYGTWAQCVNYCVHNKLGNYHQHGWLGHVLDTDGRYEIREVDE